MTKKHLAVYTFGIFRVASDDPENTGFHDRNDANLLAAEESEGFVARSGYEDEPGPESWGAQVYPRFYAEKGDGWSPSTLSLWEDLESLMAFSYSGIHADALKHGREWFLKPAWPPFALWWVDEGHTPCWTEAAARHEYLHDHGPSAHVFNLKTPFGPDGGPATIDRERVKEIARKNGAR